MSTEYRKADCQSTKNVGGNKPVDPQSGKGGTSLGFTVQPEHAYLGHFKQEKYLREGHNNIFGDVVDKLRDVGGGLVDKARGVARGMNPLARSGSGAGSTFRRPDAVGTTNEGNIVARTGKSTTTMAADAARRGIAKAAIKSGGVGADLVAAERPVLAARTAAKMAGVKGADRRALVKAARMDPNSARSERRAKRGY